MNVRQNISLGVGDGAGQLFVHGDHASISACQQKLLELERMRAENEALREALGAMMKDCKDRGHHINALGGFTPHYQSALSALAAHDKGAA